MAPGTARLLSVKMTPPLRPPTLGRAGLVKRLRDAVDTPLTLLAAPVGAGKTSLLAAWVHDPAEPRAVAWLSLDADDDEPVRFWQYVVASLRRVAPDLGRIATDALEVPGVDPTSAVLPGLLDDAAELERGVVLVLDDYHHVRDPRIHRAVEFLLAYSPPTLRLLVATRQDPPLPLARLRARGQLTEIRAADLRLDVGETAHVVAETLGAPVPRDVLDDLCDRTEGWAAAVRLAALAARGTPDPAGRLRDLRGDHRHLADLLAGEVLDHLDPEVEDALVRTAVLGRLTGPLCDAVLGRAGIGGLLRDLEGAHLPIVPLDDHRSWYRLHHLLRDELRRRLHERHGPVVEAELHRRAASWFHHVGDHEAAVRHLLAAGDHDQACDVLAYWPEMSWSRGQIGTYLLLADRLPVEVVARRPELAVALGWAHGLLGDRERSRQMVELVLAAPLDGPRPVGWSTLEGSVCALRVGFGHVGEPAEMLRLAMRAAALEQDTTLTGHAAARMCLGVAHMANGDLDAAEAAIEEAVAVGHALDPGVAVVAVGLLASARLARDDDAGAQAVVDRWMPVLDDLEARVAGAAAAATAGLRTVAGGLARRRGDLAGAASELRRAAEAARTVGLAPLLVDALGALAEVRLLQGDRREAQALVRECREVVGTGAAAPHLTARVDALETTLGRSARRAARSGGTLAEELTDRELSVLRAMQGPLSLPGIAAELYLSPHTVKGYAKVLYRKLGVNSREDAVARGRQLGML